MHGETMLEGQLILPMPGQRWAEVVEPQLRGTPVGTRFLVVEERDTGWLVCWRDGLIPHHTGTLLRKEHVRTLPWDELKA